MREVEELKLELHRLSSLEGLVEHLTQNMARILQTVEETQKTMATLTLPRGVEEDEVRSVVEKGCPANAN